MLLESKRMMHKMSSVTFICIFITCILFNHVNCDSNDKIAQKQQLAKIFENCHKNSTNFDPCIKTAFNDLRVHFKTGFQALHILPFDPHHAEYVEQRRGLTFGRGNGYRLILRKVSELGWTNSKVTKYKTDKANNKIIYSQDFPVKSLNGEYEFKASMLGQTMHTKGVWNMTLYDYAQTTSVTRVGGPGGILKVRVEIDKLGDLKLNISDLFNGRKVIESTADFLINNMWQPGFPFVRPLINDLVSTAFTDIFNESFRDFPIDEYIME